VTYDGSAYTVRLMQPKDVPAAVAVHQRAFPSFFLTFLGPRFLHLLYSKVLDEQGGVALVAEDQGGQVCGFVAGVSDQSGFYSRLARRNWLAFSLTSLQALLRRPKIAARLLRALTYGRSSREAAAQALLMSIAVLPECNAQGVGQKLVRRFLQAMQDRRVPAVSLTTDRDANEHANRFYQRLGFQLARSYVTREGRAMNEYVIDLRS
jgi:ribosomal protein S18 acetylase RimI-like enzyme